MNVLYEETGSYKVAAVLTEGGVVEAAAPDRAQYWGIEFAQKRVEREDAARSLGCSISALDVRLHRARAALRKKFEERQ